MGRQLSTRSELDYDQDFFVSHCDWKHQLQSPKHRFADPLKDDFDIVDGTAIVLTREIHHGIMIQDGWDCVA